MIHFKEQDMMKFNPNAILFGLKNNEVLTQQIYVHLQ